MWKLDRLGRSLGHLLQLLDELRHLSVGFVSVRDAGIDTTSASGRLLLHLLAAFAEYERAMLRERVTAGIRKAQAEGRHCGRPRREVDVRPAVALLEQGHGLKEASRILGVARSTLRRRLEEAGEWPRPASGAGSTTPASGDPVAEA